MESLIKEAREIIDELERLNEMPAHRSTFEKLGKIVALNNSSEKMVRLIASSLKAEG